MNALVQEFHHVRVILEKRYEVLGVKVGPENIEVDFLWLSALVSHLEKLVGLEQINVAMAPVDSTDLLIDLLNDKTTDLRLLNRAPGSLIVKVEELEACLDEMIRI